MSNTSGRPRTPQSAPEYSRASQSAPERPPQSAPEHPRTRQRTQSAPERPTAPQSAPQRSKTSQRATALPRQPQAARTVPNSSWSLRAPKLHFAIKRSSSKKTPFGPAPASGRRNLQKAPGRPALKTIFFDEAFLLKILGKASDHPWLPQHKNAYLHTMNLNIFCMPQSGASNLARALLIRMTWEGGWEWAWLLYGFRPVNLTPISVSY